MTSTLESQPPPPQPSAAVREVRVAIIGSGFAGLGMAIALQPARRDRLPRPRAGRRRRRHLARQHLPRRRLRRAVQPLLVLLRAQPGLVALLLPAAGDPGLPAARRRAASASSTGSVFGADVDAAPAGTTTPRRWQVPHDGRRRSRAARAGLRPPAPWPTRPARHRRHRLLRRRGLPLRALGPRLRPHRQAGRRHRHRRLGDPDRPGDPADRSRTSTSTSAPRRGSCPAATARSQPLERLALPRTCPALQKAYRTGVYWVREFLVPRHRQAPPLRSPVAQGWPWRTCSAQVRDPELREALTPDFEIGCKRILISNDYYPALAATNVDLVTDRIAEVTPHSIVDRGRHRAPDRRDRRGHRLPHHRPADRRAHQRPRRPHPRRRLGRTGMAAYKGTTVAGFPNLFLLVGPNTGLGHSSMVFMIESQVAYVVDALQHHGRRGPRGRSRPRAQAQQAWTAT